MGGEQIPPRKWHFLGGNTWAFPDLPVADIFNVIREDAATMQYFSNVQKVHIALSLGILTIKRRKVLRNVSWVCLLATSFSPFPRVDINGTYKKTAKNKFYVMIFLKK